MTPACCVAGNRQALNAVAAPDPFGITFRKPIHNNGLRKLKRDPLEQEPTMSGRSQVSNIGEKKSF